MRVDDVRSQLVDEHPTSSITLAVVRVITSCLVSVMGTYIIDDPSGILGGRGEFSATGMLLSGAWTVSAFLSVIGICTKNIWGAPLACLFTFSAVAFFSLIIPTIHWWHLP